MKLTPRPKCEFCNAPADRTPDASTCCWRHSTLTPKGLTGDALEAFVREKQARYPDDTPDFYVTED